MKMVDPTLDFEPGDIDIYVPHANHEKLLSYLSLTYEFDGEIVTDCYPHRFPFISVCNLKKGDTKVQLMKCCGSSAEATKLFDLDVCKCIWDPSIGIAATHPDVVAAVRLRKATLNLEIPILKARVSKYQSRGFTITNLPAKREDTLTGETDEC
jgi:hypothetical protein